MDKHLKDFFSNVEKEHEVPIILSRYGFKKELIDGKVYLVAATKEELEEQIKAHEPALAPSALRYCWMDLFGRCYASDSCTGGCERKYGGFGIMYCSCRG